tara:strand:- start:55542 stop:57509 length:1968 start_codon:yes stop_codon:yes gene_type:complete
MILCTLNHIHLAFGERVIFNDEKIIIKDDDRIGLLGLNGQGKSSLLKIINGEVTPDTVVPPFQVDQAETFSVFHVPQELPEHINLSITPTELFYSFFPELNELHLRSEEINSKFENELTESETQKLLNEQKNVFDKIDHMDGWKVFDLFQSYLKYFGFEEIEKPLSELSGGQLKKIILSIGFSSNASLILWDEPTNHLDINSIELFEDELRNQNKAFLLVTHDRYLLSKVCNRIYQIDRGSIKDFKGTYAQYLEHLHESEELRVKSLQKIQNSLKRETEWMRQGIRARGTRSKKRVENYHGLLKSVQTIKNNARNKIQLDISASRKKTKKILSLDSASFQYDEGKSIFKNVSLEVFKGDKIGLIGDNGIGKTTLVNCLIGDLLVSAGKQYRADELNVQYFKQMKDEWEGSLTPYDILGDGTDYVSLPDGSKMHVAGYFQKFLFHQSQLNRPISTFSGGEKTRLQLAYHLRTAGDIWIFDEPTNDLDLDTINLLEETLTNFKGTVLLISHDRSFLSNVTNKTILMANKSLEVFQGGYSQAEEFIEASNIEKRLLESENKTLEEDNNDQNPQKETGGDSTLTPSFQDKKAYETALKEVSEFEAKVEQADALIVKLSENPSSEDITEKIVQLSQKKDEWENQLLSIYEVIESFQSKYN